MALLLKVSGEYMANSTENTQVVLTVPPPVLVAHRGYSGRYPENTLLSYEAAIRMELVSWNWICK